MVARILETLIGTEGDAWGTPILSLMNGPLVTQGQRVLQIPEGSQRLVVFVALSNGAVDRRQAAGTLWPDGDDERAAGNLRSALWRLNRKNLNIVAADKHRLWLAPCTRVDVHLLMAWSSRVLLGRPESSDLGLTFAEAGSMELLPGWYEEWVLVARERLRQRLLHTLEELARILTEVGRIAEAVDIATVAAAAEPLRESAQRVLLRAHLAEGNVGEARRAYRMYRELVATELGVDVSRDLQKIIDDTGTNVHLPIPRPCVRSPALSPVRSDLIQT